MPRAPSLQSRRRHGTRRAATHGETAREVQVMYNTSSTCDSKTCATTASDGGEDKACTSDQLEEAGSSGRHAALHHSRVDGLPPSPHRTSAARRARADEDEEERDEASLLLGALPLSIVAADEVEGGGGPVHDPLLSSASQINDTAVARGQSAALSVHDEAMLSSSPACSPPHARTTSTSRGVHNADCRGASLKNNSPPAAVAQPHQDLARPASLVRREGRPQDGVSAPVTRTPTWQNGDSSAPLFIDDETPLLPPRVDGPAPRQAAAGTLPVRPASPTASPPRAAHEDCASSEDSEVVIEEAPHTPSSAVLFAPAHTVAAGRDVRDCAQRLMPGMNVEGRWGGRWFAAVVMAEEHNGYVQIRWNADGSFLHLKRREVRLPRCQDGVSGGARCDALDDGRGDGVDDGVSLRPGLRNASCTRGEEQSAARRQRVNRVLDDSDDDDDDEYAAEKLHSPSSGVRGGECGVNLVSPVMTATQLVAMMDAEDAEEAQNTCAVKATSRGVEGRTVRRPCAVRGDCAPLPPRKRARDATPGNVADRLTCSDVAQDAAMDACAPRKAEPSVCAQRLVLWNTPAARAAMRAPGTLHGAVWQRGLSRLVCDGAVVTDSLAYFGTLVTEALSQPIMERVFLCLVPQPDARGATAARQAGADAAEECLGAVHYADAIGVHAVTLAWLRALADGAETCNGDAQAGITYGYPAPYIVHDGKDDGKAIPYIPLAMSERFLSGKMVYMAADDDAMEWLVRLAGGGVQRRAAGLQPRADTAGHDALPDYCYLPPGRRVKVRPEFAAVALLDATWLWHALADHRASVVRRPYTTDLASPPASLRREASQGNTAVHPTQGLPGSLQYTQLAYMPMSREQAEHDGTVVAAPATAAATAVAGREVADFALTHEGNAVRKQAQSPSVRLRPSPPSDAAPAVDLSTDDPTTPPLPPVIEGEDYYFYLPCESDLLLRRGGGRQTGAAHCATALTLALGRVVTVSASSSTPMVTLRCYEVKGMTLRRGGTTGEVERQLTVFLGRREVTVPTRLLLFDTPVYVISAAELRHVYVLDEQDEANAPLPQQEQQQQQQQEPPSSLQWMRRAMQPTAGAVNVAAADEDEDDRGAERRRQKEQQQQQLLLQEATTVPVPRSSGSTTCDSDGLSELERDADASARSPERPTCAPVEEDETVFATPLDAAQHALLGDDEDEEGRPRALHHRFDTASTAAFTPREGSVVEELHVGAARVREGAVVCFRDHYCLAQSTNHAAAAPTAMTVANAHATVGSASSADRGAVAAGSERRLRWGKVQMMRRIHRSVALVVHMAAENSVFGGSKMCVITPDMIVDVLPPQ